MMWKKVGSVHSGGSPSGLSSLREDSSEKLNIKQKFRTTNRTQLPIIHAEENNAENQSNKATVKQSRSHPIISTPANLIYRDSNENKVTHFRINFLSEQKRERAISHERSAISLERKLYKQKWKEAAKIIKGLKIEQRQLKDYLKSEIGNLKRTMNKVMSAMSQKKGQKKASVLQQVQKFREKMVEMEQSKMQILKEHNLSLDELL